MHKSDKKTAKKVLYKHINSWIPASWVPAYDMQGFGLGQAAEEPSEITLRYLTGQADFKDFVFGGKGGVGSIWFCRFRESEWAGIHFYSSCRGVRIVYTLESFISPGQSA